MLGDAVITSSVMKGDGGMEYINIKQCEDGVLWITSDEDPIGHEFTLDAVTDEEERFLIAFCNYLGFESSEMLNIDIPN